MGISAGEGSNGQQYNWVTARCSNNGIKKSTQVKSARQTSSHAETEQNKKGSIAKESQIANEDCLKGQTNGRFPMRCIEIMTITIALLLLSLVLSRVNRFIRN